VRSFTRLLFHCAACAPARLSNRRPPLQGAQSRPHAVGMLRAPFRKVAYHVRNSVSFAEYAAWCRGLPVDPSCQCSRRTARSCSSRRRSDSAELFRRERVITELRWHRDPASRHPIPDYDRDVSMRAEPSQLRPFHRCTLQSDEAVVVPGRRPARTHIVGAGCVNRNACSQPNGDIRASSVRHSAGLATLIAVLRSGCRHCGLRGNQGAVCRDARQRSPAHVRTVFDGFAGRPSSASKCRQLRWMRRSV
jgi:hypothetical protein